jgi:hypothetical protein
VIYFVCPACGEELEAEDSIRGARMKCPACAKDLEVPQASLKVPARVTQRPDRRSAYAPSGSPSMPGGQFIAMVLGAGVVGLLILSAAGYVLNKKVREVRSRSAACVVCSGEKNVACARCNRGKTMPCPECAATGRRKNWRDEEEACFACNGTGRQRCPVCGGEGVYSCAACYGRGREGAEPPPMYDFK